MTYGFVGADVIQIGETQAKAAVEKCGPSTSGEVLILEGPPTSPFSAYMQKGYENILSKAPHIKVVSRQSTGDYEFAKAKSITQVVLQQHPNLCAVLGIWDNTDVGTAAAIREAGKTGKVFVSTSGGGGELSCKGLREGLWDHYVSYDVPGQARDRLDLVSQALQDGGKIGPTKTILYTPLVTYTRDNVNDQSGLDAGKDPLTRNGVGGSCLSGRDSRLCRTRFAGPLSPIMRCEDRLGANAVRQAMMQYLEM